MSAGAPKQGVDTRKLAQRVAKLERELEFANRERKDALETLNARLDELLERFAEMKSIHRDLNKLNERLSRIEQAYDNRFGGLLPGRTCPKCHKRSFAALPKCEHCGGSLE